MELNKREQARLAEAAHYFQNQVAPAAAEIEGNATALKKAFLGMGDRSLLALRIPAIWGGGEFSEIGFRYFQMMIARYSGALAFLQTQHQSAASQLYNSENEMLKKEYLPSMAKGKKLIGVGFSQLRRPGKPTLTAFEVAGGYLLEGEVPWITGFDFFEEFIVGAVLPDGQGLYGMVPLRDNKQTSGGYISFSEPLPLIAMTSTNTVKGRLKQWFLATEKVVTIKPAGAIHQSDRLNVLHHGFFALGCAQAGLDILEVAYQNKQNPILQTTWHKLTAQVNSCRQAYLAALSAESFEKKLQLRATAINLAYRCAQAAVIASSGAANSQLHPAGRVYREALMFSVAGQTTGVMEATLQQL